MFATKQQDAVGWDFILGDLDNSIARERYEHIFRLNVLSKDKLKLSFRDSVTNKWTKHQGFYNTWRLNEFHTAYDIHRSMLPYEIIIESDYPTYEENYEATRIIGEILEQKGFSPHYYYSGNKSIHIHVYFDFTCLFDTKEELQDKVIATFKFKYMFVRKFMKWLREKMISCWDTGAKMFDKDLINEKHLIRCEMSRNKQGYKTFLGYTYQDVSFVPIVCNEENGFYPKIGEIRLSSPKEIDGLLESFLLSLEKKTKKRRLDANNADLRAFFKSKGKIRPCVDFILSDEFKASGDGFKRALFVLANELKKVYDPDKTLSLLLDWNSRMDFPLLDEDIRYRLRIPEYTLSCKYIHTLLDELGFKQQFHK